MTDRKPLPRPLVIVVFGPLVGAFAAFLYFLALNLLDPTPVDEPLYAVFSLLLITLVTGWVTGLPAAVISALAWHFLEPKLARPLLPPVALALGAAASIVTTLPIIYTVFGTSIVGANGFVLVGAIGALSMAVTALPGGRPV